MIKKLKRMLTPASSRKMKVKSQSDAHFHLMFEDILVGQLSYNNGIWEFKYSDEFKNEHAVKPLADFPNLEIIYKNEVLWPFFSSRIPSLARSRVQNIIAQEGIDAEDLLALLKRFGTRTITNPFVLKSF